MTAIDTLGKDIAAIKAQYFRGVTKVNFKALNFKYPLAHKYHRGPSKKKVIVLKNVFKKTSYDRLTKKHFIKAIIDNNILADTLRVFNINKNTLYQKKNTTKIPYLPITQINYLNGLHYIHTTKQVLDPNNQ